MKRSNTKKDKTSLEVLKAYLHYDPISGVFTYKQTIGGRINKKIGDIAGTINKDGYRWISVAGSCEKASRLAWLYMTEKYPPAGLLVDHKNTITFDDSWDNLRLATTSQNMQNKSIDREHSTQIKGISTNRSGGNPPTYTARLTVNKKLVFCKNFKTIEEASVAIKEAREKYHGEFSNHG